MSAVRHAKAITPTFGPYGVDLEGAATPAPRRPGSLRARVALSALLSLGVIDVGVLDLQLAPRLAGGAAFARSARVPAAPIRAETQAANARAREATAPVVPRVPEAREAPSQRTPPVNRVNRVKATEDIAFDLESVKTDNIDALHGLHRVLDELAADPARRLVLRGHTDRLGTPEYNERLSRRRAAAMRDWLVVRGAPIDRIAVEAAGAEEPADDGDGPVAWAHNRRCELLWE